MILKFHRHHKIIMSLIEINLSKTRDTSLFLHNFLTVMTLYSTLFDRLPNKIPPFKVNSLTKDNPNPTFNNIPK